MKPLKILIFIYSFLFLFNNSALATKDCLKGECYNGHGTYQWSSGNQYTGTFKKGFREGQGVFTFTNGDKYIGEYKKGKRNGTGIYYFNDGSLYEGEYVDDKRNGYGIFTLPNGARYEGEYKDGSKSGRGKFTFPDGKTMNGTWEGNSFVEPVASSGDNSSQKHSLTINPLPHDATIKFIDRSLVYKPGIKLSPGRYKVELSHSRYIKKVEIIDILKGDLIVPVIMKLDPQAEMQIRSLKNIINSKKESGDDLGYNSNRGVRLTRGGGTFDSLYNEAQQGGVDQKLSEINQQRINEALRENKNAKTISIIEQVKQEIEMLKVSLLDPKVVSIQRLPGSSTDFDRVALVIGNSQYVVIGALKNPEHDAKDIAAALRKLDFKVTVKINIDQEEMEIAIAEFGKRIQKDSLGLFYYAGHGVQMNGNNYLIPVHSGIKKARDIRYKAVDLNMLIDEMIYAENGKNIIILDSCRNNPLPKGEGRNPPKGLARTDAPAGTLISYATSPGSVAIDGEGRNGVYTQYLLENIFTPGIPVEMVFKRVLQGVAADTGRKQIPWMSSSLDVDFYFAAK